MKFCYKCTSYKVSQKWVCNDFSYETFIFPKWQEEYQIEIKERIFYPKCDSFNVNEK